jgi:hypothetical protein
MSAEGDPSDRIFLNYLKEISQAYRVLPKQLRLRCEKWVEKLTQTGSNPTWKKHRNSYARLLLNMIMTKQLTDPFHVNPPDGPLPTFPAHMKCQLKDMMGAHESSFWRDLFTQVAADPQRTANSNKTSGPDYYNPNTREVQDLSLLVKEQAKRIELLEQQLHDERLQHELQLQRQVFNSRVELEKLRKTTQSYSDVINQSVSSSTDRMLGATSAARHDGGVNSSRDSFVNVSRSQERSGPSLQEALSRASVDSSFHTIRPQPATSTSSSLDTTRKGPPPPVPAFDYLQKEIQSTIQRSKHLSVSDSFDTNSFSVGGTAGDGHSGGSGGDGQQEDNEGDGDGIHYPSRYNRSTTSASGSGSGNPVRSSVSGSTVAGSVPVGASAVRSAGSDDDFLSYIENFQREVRSLQLSSPEPKK